jgi:hypothetical protein
VLQLSVKQIVATANLPITLQITLAALQQLELFAGKVSGDINFILSHVKLGDFSGSVAAYLYMPGAMAQLARVFSH